MTTMKKRRIEKIYLKFENIADNPGTVPQIKKIQQDEDQTDDQQVRLLTSGPGRLKGY